jgi:hypothetical protein
VSSANGIPLGVGSCIVFFISLLGRKRHRMPVHYRFDDCIVVIEMVGEYSIDELRSAILSSIADPKRPANCCLLINMSESRSIYSRTTAEIKSMARFVGTHGERFNNRIAMVASEDAPFGLMRMGSVGSEERGVQSDVFRSFAEAKKWLLEKR